jgi:predicted alpha/beta hydrolase
MRDWSDWAQTGRLDYGQHHGLHDSISSFNGALLAISMEGDELSNPQAEERAIAVFTAARKHTLRMGADESGKLPGHFNWARHPEAVVLSILSWLRREFPL